MSSSNLNIKTEKTATDIAGRILLPAGVVFILIGVLVDPASFTATQHAANMFIIAFRGLGVIFLILGIVFMLGGMSRRMRVIRAVSSGRFVRAEILGSRLISSGGRRMYHVECRFQDSSTGYVRTYRSRGFKEDPMKYIKSRTVPVYIDPANYNNYYVDVDCVIPKNHAGMK